MNFQKILRDWRKREGLIQEVAAKQLGVRVTTYRGWEYGQRTPTGPGQTLILRTIFPNGYNDEIRLGEQKEETKELESQQNFSELLREWRQKHHLTRLEAARTLGAKYITYGNWERGVFKPRSFRQMKIRRMIQDQINKEVAQKTD